MFFYNLVCHIFSFDIFVNNIFSLIYLALFHVPRCFGMFHVPDFNNGLCPQMFCEFRFNTVRKPKAEVPFHFVRLPMLGKN